MPKGLIERGGAVRPKQLDYKEIFATTMYEMICEIFPAHGIEQMDEEEFDAMVTEITREHYWPIMGEFRKNNGLSVVSGVRFHW